MVHVSYPDNKTHKKKFLSLGAVSALAPLLHQCIDERTRHNACCALSELAFQDADLSLAIANHAEIPIRLVYLLHPSAGWTQEDAARIINNCAAFCEAASPTLASFPGLLEGLAAMAEQSSVPDVRHIATSALNALSRSPGARAAMSACRPLRRALAAALAEPGASERRAATRAAAAMALANLTGHAIAIDDPRWKAVIG